MRSKRHGELVTSLKVIKKPGGAVLFDRHSGRYLQTNEVGVEVIQELLAGKSLNKVQLQISKKYGISLETVCQDIHLFLDELVKVGLIK